jgi:WD40 repeat protein
MWISAGSDFKMREWFIEKNGTTRLLRTFVDQTHYQHFNWHTDTITDCIDIYSPNCIATSSLDGTIILYDLINNDIIRTISEQHEKGIRRLRYQRQNGNTMASIGSEIFVNIWQPESLISDIHIGRLNGHKVSIVDGNYLEKAPFFVTIDIHNIIIFWDIKTLGAMQTVRPPMKKMSIGLQVMDATKLWIFSKRFMQIDNNIFDQDEDNDP